jgi:8-oxo-dGTP diphosphatase
MTAIESKRVRGIMFDGARVLLAQDLENGHYFLPGGGVDAGESVTAALVREFREELEWHVQVRNFIGVIEQLWREERKDKTHLEINFLFGVAATDECIANPKTPEMHIGFSWHDVEKLEELKLFPEMLKTILPELYAAGGDYPVAFYSNIDSA